MFSISIIKTLYQALGITGIAIAIIAFLDYVTGSEFSFSIFYLIPLSLFALFQKTEKKHIIIFSLLAAIAWFLVDNHTKIYSNNFFPIWNATVRFAIFISFGLLLFDYKKKTQGIRAANEKLQELNDEKNKFIGMAAHDLRNPISGIQTIATMMLEGNQYQLNPESRELINLTQLESARMLELIKNILNVSKIESGNIVYQPDTQDYLPLVKSQIHISSILAKQKNISIHQRGETEHLMATFDDHLMAQVLQNLFSNALKYSNMGSEVTVTVSRNGAQILTEVTDQGPGISTEEQGKLFNYFQRGSSLPTGGEEVTGLGLAIAKKIITTHGGSIGVASKLGEGSTFFFSFPATD